MVVLLKTVFKLIRITLIILYIFLLIVHFIIKDRFDSLSVVFYSCPLPLILIFGCFLTLISLKNKRLRYILLPIVVGPLIYFGFHYFGTENKNLTSGTKFHILFWNASRNKPLTRPFLLENIKQYHPEIIALVEAGDISDENFKILKDSFSGYEFRFLEGEMLIGVKGSIDTITYHSVQGFSSINYINATIHQKPTTIMISDVIAVPIENRKKSLGIIYDFTKKNPVDVLVGDFNTPYESAFFGPFKSDFKSMHHFSLGMTSTWPIPYPVIEIDHIWLNPKYNPIKLEKFCSNISRHKMLIAEYQ